MYDRLVLNFNQIIILKATLILRRFNKNISTPNSKIRISTISNKFEILKFI